MISWLIILGIINVFYFLQVFFFNFLQTIKLQKLLSYIFLPLESYSYSEKFYYESHTWISLAKQTNINVNVASIYRKAIILQCIQNTLRYIFLNAIQQILSIDYSFSPYDLINICFTVQEKSGRIRSEIQLKTSEIVIDSV